MGESHIDSLTNSYEEIFLDYEVYIQPNRDPHRDGFEWSICRGGIELDAGLDFSIKDVLTHARSAVVALSQTGNSL